MFMVFVCESLWGQLRIYINVYGFRVCESPGGIYVLIWMFMVFLCEYLGSTSVFIWILMVFVCVSLGVVRHLYELLWFSRVNP